MTCLKFNQHDGAKFASRLVRLYVFFAIGLFTVGCTPWTTRYPTLMPSEPRGERQNFQRFDPFSVTDMGPDTMVRPRDYATPRTRERADAEEKFRRGFGGSPGPRPYSPGFGMPPGTPMGFPPQPGFGF